MMTSIYAGLTVTVFVLKNNLGYLHNDRENRIIQLGYVGPASISSVLYEALKKI